MFEYWWICAFPCPRMPTQATRTVSLMLGAPLSADAPTAAVVLIRKCRRFMIAAPNGPILSPADVWRGIHFPLQTAKLLRDARMVWTLDARLGGAPVLARHRSCSASVRMGLGVDARLAFGGP